eukprot:TRINITY_DN21260_c0_g1_i3.p1 TRINITY_DN21260_c0_g1~~TRINITY_DN21260_c0_g1_i3.p1  ORF type:complete len:389 (+),score=77.96 TRINITY_DN21260_c0_g1_i3:124-1290(+)
MDLPSVMTLALLAAAASTVVAAEVVTTGGIQKVERKRRGLVRTEPLVADLERTNEVSQQAANATLTKESGSSSTQTATTALVIFDYHYKYLLPCWGKHYLQASSIKTIDIVALDPDAKKYAQDWAAAHSGATINVDACIPEKGDPMEKYQPPQPSGDLSKVRKNLYGVEGAGEDDEKENTGNAMPGPWYDKCYWKALNERLDRGIAVLHSDLDAFIIGDPWPFLNAENTANVDIQSHVDPWPPDATHWGFAMNTGFMFFRPSPVLKTVVRDVRAQADSQSTPPHTQGLFSSFVSSQYGCTFKDEMLRGAPTNESLKVGTCRAGLTVALNAVKQCRGFDCGTYPECASKGFRLVHGRGAKVDQMCNGFEPVPSSVKSGQWHDAFASPWG